MTKYASQYSLMAYSGEVLQQGALGSCVPNAVVSTIDLQMRQAGHEVAPLSRLAYYADIRDYMGTFKYDSGTSANAMIYASVFKGFAYESDWEYNLNNTYVHPTESVNITKIDNHVTSWTYITGTQNLIGLHDTVAKYLSEGKPIVLYFTPQSYFYQELGPLESLQGYGPHDSSGRHAVEIVGMNDTLNGGSYIIKNSWGSDNWGDNGYGVISYKQFAVNPDYQEIQGFYVMNGFVHDGVTYDFTYSAERVAVNTEYATILGRAADVAGLNWWAGVIKSGVSKASLADQLINSTEGSLVYGSLDTKQFVEVVYKNVLGRDADSAGLSYWENAINTGGISKGKLFSDFIDSVNKPNAEAHDLLTNKVNLANYVSIALHYSEPTEAKNAYVHDLLLAVDGSPDHTELLKIGIADIIHGIV